MSGELAVCGVNGYVCVCVCVYVCVWCVNGCVAEWYSL